MRTWVPALILGLFLWTLLEYLLHRFVFHRFRGLIGSFHLEHHAAPRNIKYLFVRPLYALGASVLLIILTWTLTGSLARTAGLMGGVWAGFLYYESVHYRVHFTAAEGPLISLQRRLHFEHHFRDARRCFGVTTPVWDIVFRTRGSRSG